MVSTLELRQWIKRREHPAARAIYGVAMGVRQFSMPVIPPIHKPLYAAHVALTGGWGTLTRALWYTPLFQARLTKPAKGLFLYGGMPYVAGPVEISIAEKSRMSGAVTITGRTTGTEKPALSIGSNCDIGWQTTIAVGSKVIIADDVRLGGRNFLAGYPGHPLDPVARAAGAPETEEQVGDIVLEQGVWLATGVIVSAGVTIGHGTVVAAGSVVTKDLPANVLAAGMPAKVIKSIVAEDKPSLVEAAE